MKKKHKPRPSFYLLFSQEIPNLLEKYKKWVFFYSLGKNTTCDMFLLPLIYKRLLKNNKKINKNIISKCIKCQNTSNLENLQMMLKWILTSISTW